MLEMLSVLAIVGVLSVGAISGYSKAMLKYKLNKQAESFNLLLNNALVLDSTLSRSVSKNKSLDAEIFKKLNMIPDGFKYNNKTIYDVFGSAITINYNYSTSSDCYYYSIPVKMEITNGKISSYYSKICENIINVTKQNSANLYAVALWQNNDEAGSWSADFLYGDNLCSGNKKCLKNMTVKDTNEYCLSCNSEFECTLRIFIKYCASSI